MKIKSLLFGMLACTALVGCSNEDDPVVNNGSEETLANSYMAIRIADANNVTSRGEGGAYDEGVDAERKIVDARCWVPAIPSSMSGIITASSWLCPFSPVFSSVPSWPPVPVSSPRFTTPRKLCSSWPCGSSASTRL